MEKSTQSFMEIEEVRALIRRQDELEKQIKSLKRSLYDVKDENKKTIDLINRRIDRLEDDIAQVRKAIEKIMASMDTVQVTVTNMSEKVGEINAKQDVALNAQDKFIGQLWKAFFAVLTIVSAGSAAIIALLK